MHNTKNNPTAFNTPHSPTWCPGCGDWSLWAALKGAMTDIGFEPQNTVIVYGIGCSGNMTNTVNTYGFHGLHGRAIPVAAGVKLANHKLNVIVITGDGDCYGEGLSHFIHGARANHDITVIVHDNQVYGLTTGQTSPTSHKGYKSKSTPGGAIEKQLNPLALSLDAGATFVARGFAGDIPYLTQIFKQAMSHSGFSHVDVFQPCVTFNKHNTYQWFNERIYKLDASSRQLEDYSKAHKLAREEEKLPIGVFYRTDRPSYHQSLPQLAANTLIEQDITDRDINNLVRKYI